MDFSSFNLHDDVLTGISSMGYNNPTPVQEQAIPLILERKDMIACAQTGTGKTAAYLLPLIDRISHEGYEHTSTLILVPTRELAKQIDEQVEGFGYFASVSSIAIYGGNKGDDWEQQKRALTTGADIIIATPGRLISHMAMGYVKLDQLNHLVLDEADKMLDMGFMDDLLKIINQLPKERQTLLFSATMPRKIRDLAQQILQNPEEINLAISKPAEGIDQRIYLTYDNQKLPLLEHLLRELDVQSMIIFTSRKSNVNQIVRSLQKMGFTAEGIQSDMTQDERERALQGFKNKQYQIVVATDILSRGIDIDSLSHVVNFDMPQDAEDYVHRVGRTARAASTGMAITFVNEKDMYRVQKVERLIERELPKLPLPDGFGAGPAYEPGKRHDMGSHRHRGGNKPGSGGSNKNHRSKHHRNRKPPGQRHEEGNDRPIKAANQGPRPEGQSSAAAGEGNANRKRKRNNRNRNSNRNGAQGQRPQGENQQPAS
ncbi:superfamily II DNA/RNA helicase [Pontibacter ummariensis]|uniref:Superfamily II DNA and RNA helicase n=2 Tax=Pontibacter ummariensis TaxID=1610492 RepID=A0A239F1Q3_9BACT|nr:superfamily II DNA/RNA helicase [Pontibacter ummariensis]SNS50082.1 Superfamily II DNA and RNA helicase [Pontibacter ummariensis]